MRRRQCSQPVAVSQCHECILLAAAKYCVCAVCQAFLLIAHVLSLPEDHTRPIIAAQMQAQSSTMSEQSEGDAVPASTAESAEEQGLLRRGNTSPLEPDEAGLGPALKHKACAAALSLRVRLS